MSDIEQNPMNPDPTGQEGLSTADLAGGSGQNTSDVAAESRSFQPGGQAQKSDKPTPLLPEKEVGDFRNRWTDIQAGFVDEPRRAVQDADELVASAMKRLAEMFAQERSKLEGQWDRGDQVGTEELRVALQRYRSFFDRLLAV